MHNSRGVPRGRKAQDERKRIAEETEKEKRVAAESKTLTEKGKELDILIDALCTLAKWQGEGYHHTLLHTACRDGRLNRVAPLIAAGAAIEEKSNNGNTPLSLAAFHGHLEVARLLLASGAEVEANNNGGYTPLSLAALKGHTDIIAPLGA